ncbi:MAG TPA: MFS transporter [Candidatus Saccharimonadales bacterium]|nr:MFS transporter [Candidatus Saccharimonadales bacterium]
MLWWFRAVYLLMGLMFWYGIEQLFLDKYLHNPSARGYVTIAFTATLVLFDIPGGILADRIGRKFCLVWSALALIAGLAILGTSKSLPMYLAGTVVFGLFWCLFDGAAQALLYDWLAARKETKRYAKLQGGMYAVWLTGAGIANLLSGFIGHFWGLRSAYLLSAIPGLLALYCITRLREVPHEAKKKVLWYTHLADVVREIRRHKLIVGFALQLVVATIVLMTIGEFGQIYILSFGVSTIVLGLLWAATAAFAAGGRGLAHRLQRRPRLAIGLFCVALVAFAAIHSVAGIALFFLVYGLNEAVSNIAETEIQDATSSHIRATMLSVVNFAGNTLAIPVVLLFTLYYRGNGIIAANQLVALAAAVVLLATVLLKPVKRIRTKNTLDTAPAPPRTQDVI